MFLLVSRAVQQGRDTRASKLGRFLQLQTHLFLPSLPLQNGLMIFLAGGGGGSRGKTPMLLSFYNSLSKHSVLKFTLATSHKQTLSPGDSTERLRLDTGLPLVWD